MSRVVSIGALAFLRCHDWALDVDQEAGSREAGAEGLAFGAVLVGVDGHREQVPSYRVHAAAFASGALLEPVVEVVGQPQEDLSHAVTISIALIDITRPSVGDRDRHARS